MMLDEWRFNLRIAWENRFLRWLGIFTLAILLISSIYSGIRLFSLSLPAGFVVTHYTVYLGIDQVLPSYWLILILLVPIFLVSGTMGLSFLFFRQDAHAGGGLMALATTTAIIWIIQLFHLIKINI
jgi:hypothetical protein